MWVLDVADLSTYKQNNRENGADYILCCVEVFSCFLRTAGLKKIGAVEVGRVFSKWTRNVTPKIVLTDGGSEFTDLPEAASSFQQLLRRRGIGHRVKGKHGTNNIAVVDRKI